jgi:DNA replication licensing factor MCM5
MEQQTISVAKAGITTMLNCRNSVLAAANPIYGRYDDLRDVGDNINLMSTILSRFDCIFIIRDIREHNRDIAIAKHVLGVHIQTSLAGDTLNAGTLHSTTNGSTSAAIIDDVIPLNVLKKYIMFCRERCAPRLNDEAATLLNGQYVHIRNIVRQNILQQGHQQVVPITIRQLEAIIRLAESLAKMRLSAEATISDVEEALRLFKISTLSASQSNPTVRQNLSSTDVDHSNKNVQLAEQFLKRRIALRSTVGTKKIFEEAEIQGYSHETFRVALRALVLRNELQELHSGKLIRRIK